MIPLKNYWKTIEAIKHAIYLLNSIAMYLYPFIPLKNRWNYWKGPWKTIDNIQNPWKNRWNYWTNHWNYWKETLKLLKKTLDISFLDIFWSKAQSPGDPTQPGHHGPWNPRRALPCAACSWCRGTQGRRGTQGNGGAGKLKTQQEMASLVTTKWLPSRLRCSSLIMDRYG